MADIRISDLTPVTNLNNGDFVEVSQENAQAQTGFTSMKASMSDIGNKVNNSLQFTSALQTTAKTIIGAINEVNERNTSVEITPSFIHTSITNDNLLTFYKYGGLLVINGVFRGTNVPRYTTLYTLPNIKVKTSYFPFIQYGGGVGYLSATTNGNNTDIMIANSNLTNFDNYNATTATIIVDN